MSDANKVFFCLDEAWTEKSLEELVAFLGREYAVALPPGFEFVETVRSASETTQPSHHVDELIDGFGSLSIEVGDGIDCALQHDVPSEENTAALDYPNILLSVPRSHLRAGPDEDESAAADRIDGLYDFFAGLYAFLREAGRKPRYVYGLTGEDERRIATPEYAVTLNRDRIENDELPGVYWFQIVPPAIVVSVGEETLLSAPAYRVERLSDGSVLLVLREYPGGEASEREGASHLGVPSATEK